MGFFCCCQQCDNCEDGNAPDAYEFTFSSVTAGGCSEISKINKTHEALLNQNGGVCKWESTEFYLCSFLHYWEVALQFGVYTLRLWRTSPSSILRVSYRKNTGVSYPDCLSSHVLTKEAGLGDSYFTNWPSTVTISP